MSDLVVTSHVGRDLLQAAQHFRTDHAVVWEYVSNGLEYTSPGDRPKVVVSIDERKKLIQIADNGRGMSFSDLEHFFTMHGENRERAAGRPGRGLFGTGKSAAFGIADTLQVTSVQSGKRTVAKLSRSDVEGMADGSPVPVRVIERERITGEPNGTVVEISGIHLRRINRGGIIRYIERHLSHYPRDVEVFVDHHQCEFKEPDVAEEYPYSPTGAEALVLGNVTLQVKVAKGPLPEELRGIQIFSRGNWHETTLAGCEGKEMAEYIFGNIDVPAIEEYSGPIAPFDNTRSGQLNPNNETVAALYRFVGPRVDDVRRKLVARERKRARSEQAKRLAEQANRISEVLNEDFSALRVKLKRIRSAISGRDLGKKQETLGGDEEGPMVEGGAHLASELRDASSRGSCQGSLGRKPPNLPTPVARDDEGNTTGTPAGGEGRSRSARGGLKIEYREMGEAEPRGKYNIDGRVITINLEHPEVAAAYKLGGPDDPLFVRLTAEIATAEYAVAIATELVETYTMADEAIYDIHETVDRIARKFATLYEPK